MELTNITLKRKRKVYRFSKFTAKIQHFGDILARLCGNRWQNYTRLPTTSTSQLEAKKKKNTDFFIIEDTCSTKKMAKKFDEEEETSKHVATPRRREVQSCTSCSLPEHGHMHLDFRNETKELEGSGPGGLHCVAWRNRIVRDEYYTSAYKVFRSEEDEYVYEVNKWCWIKGFQTKIARRELD